ncbi:hypothetical protein LOK49_LG08G00284 [Camellia lanceoleosa]|uniref:Uncharacterized protein n=1 Tax=Camellia lanceoleosa TaxID=1840588 RepID=A0ACC0GUB3_9ERIC|nr:hypothetical protein LOK49_LG08G00284 [Camellia lanceoleosa]
MGWILRDRRGQEWKQGWTEQALASTLEIPMPLLVMFFITVLLVSTSHYLDYKSSLDRPMLNLQLFLIVVAVLVILLMHLVIIIREPWSQQRWDGSPWCVAAVVFVLLVLVSYQSSFHSQWYKLI